MVNIGINWERASVVIELPIWSVMQVIDSENWQEEINERVKELLIEAIEKERGVNDSG